MQGCETIEYFQNHYLHIEDQKKIRSFWYASDLVQQPTQSPLSSILIRLVQDEAKKQQAPRTMKSFFEQLPKQCSSKLNQLRKQSNLIVRSEEQRHHEAHITKIFLRELIIFVSFIDSNTSLHWREENLYGKSQNQIYMQLEEAAHKNTSINQSLEQETHQAKSGKTNNTSIRLTMFIKSPSQRMEEKSPDKAAKMEVPTEGEDIDNYFKQFIKSVNRLSVLKGQHSTYYLLNLRQILGKGGFGEVYKGESIRCSPSGEPQIQPWAIKTCKKNMKQYQQHNYAISQEREHEILLMLNKVIKRKGHKAGKYIIGLKEVIALNDKKYIIYEYCPQNSMRQVAKRQQIFTKKNIFEIALQLAEVLKLIHYDLITNDDDFLSFSLNFDHDTEHFDDIQNYRSIKDTQNLQKGIIHRDLKLSNILVKQMSKYHIIIKVIDWAFCKRTYTDLKINKIACGTTQYQAPEVEERVSYSCKADIWSYGAIIYELLTDKQFVDKPKGMDTKKNFREAIENMVYSQECASLSKAENTFWRALLKGTLEYEPGKRWSAREVYHHIASFHKYQSIGPMDFVAIVKFKEAKDQIMRHLPALEPFFRRTRFMRQTFSLYAKFLEQGVDFLIRKRVQTKINLQSSLLEKIKFRRVSNGQNFVRSETVSLRMGEVVSFLKQYSSSYVFHEQFMSCLGFIGEEYELYHSTHST